VPNKSCGDGGGGGDGRTRETGEENIVSIPWKPELDSVSQGEQQHCIATKFNSFMEDFSYIGFSPIAPRLKEHGLNERCCI
jgi:hypothetical protein